MMGEENLFEIAYLRHDSLNNYVEGNHVDIERIRKESVSHSHRHFLAGLKHADEVVKMKEEQWPGMLFLNEDADDLADTLCVEEVLVLHSEPELQYREILLFDGGKRKEESLLLKEFLNLSSIILTKSKLFTNANKHGVLI